jgi:hypothetical protein
MILWKYNNNIEMELEKPTLECFDRFVKTMSLSIFLGKEGIRIIRKQFSIDISNNNYQSMKNK